MFVEASRRKQSKGAAHRNIIWLNLSATPVKNDLHPTKKPPALIEYQGPKIKMK